MNTHDHDHDHDHGPDSFRRTKIETWFHRMAGHSHHSVEVDAAMEQDARGIRALKISLAGLFVTAFLQLSIVALSGSVGLLSDALHNLADALTSIPLWIAFTLIRRGTTSRFTYGYGKTEDIAGMIVVFGVFVSACSAVYESTLRFFSPEPMSHPGWVAAAALVGFVGNEAVAQLRIGTGRRIGSAALIADGQHSRIDGLTSLMVLAGVAGSTMGHPLADPLVGMTIGLVILYIAGSSVRPLWFRLLDAIEPEHPGRIREVAVKTPGVRSVSRIRARWSGHRIYSEIDLEVDPHLSMREAEMIASNLEGTLRQTIPFLGEAVVRCGPTR
jgi:cation diffusion facilitator family transporter